MKPLAIVMLLICSMAPAVASAGDTEVTVLVPVMFSGPGAYESFWNTDVFIFNNSDFDLEPLISDGPAFCIFVSGPVDPGPPCLSVIYSMSTVSVSADKSRGLLLRFPRTVADNLAFSANVRDITREEISFGAELPIVTEDDFHAGPIDFLNLPIAHPDYRIMLRVYALDTDVASFRYELFNPGSAIYSESLTAIRHAVDEPAFASSYIVDRPREFRTTRVQVRGDGSTPFWAFLTITNNLTQQVTIVRPQNTRE